MRNFIYIFVSIIIFSVLLSEEAIKSEEAVKYQNLPAIGKDDFTLLSGESVDFNGLYSDGPLLVSFWFLGCGPCVAEMKHLSKFNEKYKDTGFQVISINTDTKSKGKVKSFVKKRKYSFDMLFDLNGKNGFLKKLGSSSCPFTALVNMDGTIYSKHLGYERGDEIELEKEILHLIDYNKKFKKPAEEIKVSTSNSLDSSSKEIKPKELIKATE